MHPKLEKFFAEREASLQADQARHKAQVLQSLGLVEEEQEREYITRQEKVYLKKDEYCVETVNGQTRYYRLKHRPIAVSDEEFARIEAILEAEKGLAGDAKTAEENSAYREADVQFDVPTGAPCIWIRFFKILAWVYWLGGLVAAIYAGVAVGRASAMFSYNYYEYQNAFNFMAFLAVAVIAALGGGTAMATSWAFSKLDRLAQRLEGFKCFFQVRNAKASRWR